MMSCLVAVPSLRDEPTRTACIHPGPIRILLAFRRYLEKDFDEIHFFGDKTYEGGNDFEIFEDTRTIGHTVKDPADTMRQLEELFFKK